MRKIVALTAALALGAIFVAPTVAQAPETSVTVKAKVTPNKAGTKRKPQGVKLITDVKWASEAGVEPPIITGARVYFPKGSKYNGGKYPKCSFDKLKRSSPAKVCPKKSIMGFATATALADTVVTRPKVTIVNGGATKVCLYTVLNNPARVQACVPGRIKKLRHPKWQYQLTLTVPEVLQIVAGVPITLRSFHAEAGYKPYARDWLATTGCPKSRRWAFEVETFYLYSDDTTSSSKYADSMRCRR